MLIVAVGGPWLALPLGASPWVDPGDAALREDIELLADAGVLRAPITTWPLSWGDIARDLERADTAPLHREHERAALLRLRREMQLHTSIKRVRRTASLELANEPRRLRTFEDTPREDAELRGGIEWTGLRFAYRLQATVVSDASDDRIARADGSYFGVAIGNFMLSAGQLERWWGPGWHGSLILSTNARPIPAVSLRRNFSDAPTQRWLRWMGPWTLSAVMGQLEHGRVVPDALFFGFRFNFRPLPGLELGISRSAQWCGSGRPCDAETFADLLLGRDNRGGDLALEEEPGNQLAGVDWRWRLPLERVALAWYGQMIGEDEAGGLPSRFIGLSGLSWRSRGVHLGGQLSGRLEVADTAAEFYSDPIRFDYAYEHGIYRDGYRYRNRSIGHAIDNDARMVSVELTLRRGDASRWRGLLRHVDLNRGGTRPNPVAAVSGELVDVEFGYTRDFVGGRLGLGVGLEQLDLVGSDSEEDVRVYASWHGEI